ncbi:hypothetical protein T4A_7902 [Trichinella pseudospiralis]|uniref:Uncharacterized protein n=1 Tax=Trichinella pseudospiralis TaxID=6337 RepID=A0A0V1F072_TRIPS|nr:hypothetical protein T4A_7902 [Trichinella pseudospiralis]
MNYSIYSSAIKKFSNTCRICKHHDLCNLKIFGKKYALVQLACIVHGHRVTDQDNLLAYNNVLENILKINKQYKKADFQISNTSCACMHHGDRKLHLFGTSQSLDFFDHWYICLVLHTNYLRNILHEYCSNALQMSHLLISTLLIGIFDK